MSVKIRPVLICTLSLLLSACSGSASAPDSAEDAKVSAEVSRLSNGFRSITAGQRLTLSDAGSEGYLRENRPAGVLAGAKMLGALNATA